MKAQEVIKMVKDVRLILEENINSVPLEGVTDVGTISINRVIEGILVEAVTSVVKIAPMRLFSTPKIAPLAASGGVDNSGTILINSVQKGVWVKKPSDYLRFLYVTSSEWKRPVMELTTLSSPYLSIARSEINLSVGNAEKPLVVDSFYCGSPCIELYPFTGLISTTAPINPQFVYAERPVITGATSARTINCDDNLYHAAVFYAAHIVALIKGYANSERYKLEAINALGLPNQVNTNATAGAEIKVQK